MPSWGSPALQRSTPRDQEASGCGALSLRPLGPHPVARRSSAVREPCAWGASVRTYKNGPEPRPCAAGPRGQLGTRALDQPLAHSNGSCGPPQGRRGPVGGAGGSSAPPARGLGAALAARPGAPRPFPPSRGSRWPPGAAAAPPSSWPPRWRSPTWRAGSGSARLGRRSQALLGTLARSFRRFPNCRRRLRSRRLGWRAARRARPEGAL